MMLIAGWTSIEVIGVLPELMMAVVFGAVTCEQSKDNSTCFEIFSIIAGVVGLTLANITTVVLCFIGKTHVHALKNMLLYKVVLDGLLTVFVNPVTNWVGLDNFKNEIFASLLAITVYELYWSIYIGTGVADQLFL